MTSADKDEPMKAYDLFDAFACKIGVTPVTPHHHRGVTGGVTRNTKPDQLLRKRVTPVTPVTLQNNNAWDENDWQMAFEERAAILEYDGGHSRQEAERLARDEINIMRANS
jgi:hypothetical protein